MKRLSLFLSFILLLSVLALPASAYTLPANTQLTAQAVKLVSLDTGMTVFDKDPDKKMYPASLTKLMTALVVCDLESNLDNTVTVTSSAIQSLLGTDAAVTGLKPDEQLTVTELLYCLLIPSGADSAVVLADHYGNGDLSAFVAKMNEKAVSLGMNSTHFSNPTGLHDDNQYTTANDLYLLASEILKNPLLTEICGQSRHTVPATNKNGERILATTNMMIDISSSWYSAAVTGLKTGYTEPAGRCVIATAEKNGQKYMAIVLGCPAANGSSTVHHEFDDAATLFSWAFSKLSYQRVVSAQTPLSEVAVEVSAGDDHVLAVPESDFYAVIPAGSASSIIMEPHLNVTVVDAPVHRGDVLGTADILCSGQSLGTVNLVAATDCERSTVKVIVRAVKNFFTNPILLTVLAVLFAALLVLVCKNIHDNRMRRRLRMYSARRR